MTRLIVVLRWFTSHNTTNTNICVVRSSITKTKLTSEFVKNKRGVKYTNAIKKEFKSVLALISWGRCGWIATRRLAPIRKKIIRSLRETLFRRRCPSKIGVALPLHTAREAAVKSKLRGRMKGGRLSIHNVLNFLVSVCVSEVGVAINTDRIVIVKSAT